jgi:hypothetical protein
LCKWFSPKEEFSDYHLFSHSRDLKRSKIPAHDRVLIDRTTTKCSLFQTKETLPTLPSKVSSSVPIALFFQFVSALEGARVKIREANFTTVFRLCQESDLKDCGRGLGVSALESIVKSEEFGKTGVNGNFWSKSPRKRS